MVRGKTARLNSDQNVKSDSLNHFSVATSAAGFAVLVNGEENTLTTGWAVLSTYQLAVFDLVL